MAAVALNDERGVGEQEEAMSGMEPRIRDDLKSAMRAKDVLRCQVLRTILAVAKNRAIELRVESIDETEFLSVLKREAKQRAESLEFARKAEREDLVREHTAALAVVEAYLPRQMSESELREEIEAIAAAAGANGVGAVMKELSRRHAGHFDGKTASRLAGEIVQRAAR
jgi:hypothetical protein